MRKQIQCKDIPDKPVLEFLENLNGRWATRFMYEGADNSVMLAMPEGINEKLALAKMKQLYK